MIDCSRRQEPSLVDISLPLLQSHSVDIYANFDFIKIQYRFDKNGNYFMIRVLNKVIVVNGSVVVAMLLPVVDSGFFVIQTVCLNSRHGLVDHQLF